MGLHRPVARYLPASDRPGRGDRQPVRARGVRDGSLRGVDDRRFPTATPCPRGQARGSSGVRADRLRPAGGGREVRPLPGVARRHLPFLCVPWRRDSRTTGCSVCGSGLPARDETARGLVWSRASGGTRWVQRARPSPRLRGRANRRRTGALSRDESGAMDPAYGVLRCERPLPFRWCGPAGRGRHQCRCPRFRAWNAAIGRSGGRRTNHARALTPWRESPAARDIAVLTKIAAGDFRG